MMSVTKIALPAPLRGVVPPMVTPLAGQDRLDIPGLERLIERMIAGGIHALFPLGTTGESTCLSNQLRCELLERTCHQVAGRVPVLVGVTDTWPEGSVQLARFAAGLGATGVVISAPYYLPPDQEDLASYVRYVVAEQPLPVFLYNIPVLTKTGYEVDTVRRLADIDRVVGLKDSSGDLGYLEQVVKQVQRKDWTVLVGTEALLPDAIARGAHGCVGGGANLDPKLFVSLYEAAVRGDKPTIQSLQQRVMILDQIYRQGPGIASIIRGLKCALGCAGVCSDRMAEPFRSANHEEQRAIQAIVEQLFGEPPSPSQLTAVQGVATIA
ncbi:MAG TPA: dihydrodipicolinate synthase family protein [Phycisphaerae bacterium]|nr:dihydrodipicolinate synthase family protein [Phycisphaerae bacterium]HRY68741.1 dihydrodipicolinate synthase family protein [Phycisphaerae bacterium]HSA29604.1 dihydrodipicolinate synthase family protein [Phycisphaerae bacterium]